jgi:hypothetical protein
VTAVGAGTGVVEIELIEVPACMLNVWLLLQPSSPMPTLAITTEPRFAAAAWTMTECLPTVTRLYDSTQRVALLRLRDLSIPGILDLAWL